MVITGDINATSPVWGAAKVNARGKIFEKFIGKANLVCINNKQGTRVCTNGTLSHLDVVFTSANLAIKTDFAVFDESCGSDHRPIHVVLGSRKVVEKSTVNKPNYYKADWSIFQEYISEKIGNAACDNIADFKAEVITFTQIINEAIAKSVPIKNPGNGAKIKQPPFWNAECSVAVRAKHRACRKMLRTKLLDDIIAYKKCKNEVNRIIKKVKSTYWADYCSTLNRFTSITNMWKTVKNINKPTNTILPNFLKTDKITPDTNKQNANLLASQFASYNNYELKPPVMHERRALVQSWLARISRPLTTNPDMFSLNADITVKEVKFAISELKANTVAGPDGPTHLALKNLPEDAISLLCRLFNKSWTSGVVPDEWKRAYIRPILKNNCEKSVLGSWRPISQSSSMCKIMEKVVNKRLVWFMEKNNLQFKFQCGFRKNHCTIDNLIRLDDQIRSSWKNGLLTAVVFIDLSKAFDKIWIDGLIIKLFNMGICGYMLQWIRDYLTNRAFQVNNNNTLSDIVVLENGLPQGSCLSPTLFAAMTSDFPNFSGRSTASSYADDWAVSRSGISFDIVHANLQKDLDTLSDWCNKWGFVINAEKTNAVIFSKTKVKKVKKFKLNGTDIEYVSSVKYLGMLLDNKLCWKEHIVNLVNKVGKRMNILRCLTKIPWCNNKKTLTVFYFNAIRSVIDYGSVVYSNASKLLIKKIVSCQYKALKVIAGVLLGTCTAALEVVCQVPPLQVRFKGTLLKFGLTQLLYNKQCMLSTLSSMEEVCRNCKDNSGSAPEWLREVWTLLSNLNITILIRRNISYIRHFNCDRLNSVIFDYSLRNKTANEGVKPDENWFKKFTDLHYLDFIHAYTDASHEEAVGSVSAFSIPGLSVTQSFKLNRFSNALFAEFFALYKLFLYLSSSDSLSRHKVVIFSDSLFAIHSLELRYSNNHPLTLADALSTLTVCSVRDLVLCWVPGHSGIPGHDAVDSLCRDRLHGVEGNTGVMNFAGEQRVVVPTSARNVNRLHVGDLSEISEYDTSCMLLDKCQVDSLIKFVTTSQWQAAWSKYKDKSYFDLQNCVTDEFKTEGLNRQQQCALDQLRVFNSCLNKYQCKLKKASSELCQHCSVDETICHFVFDCTSETSAAVHLKKITDVKKHSLKYLLTKVEFRNIIIQQYRIRMRVKVDDGHTAVGAGTGGAE